MIGGPPVFLPPGGYAAPQFQGMPAMSAPQPYGPQMPFQGQPQQPRPFLGQAPAVPVFRGARPDDTPPPRPAPPPAPTPVSIPAPEQLGVVVAGKREQLEWAAIPIRLRELGATSCEVEPLLDGSWRFACQMATTEFGRTYPIEAHAETKAEAVRQVMEKAEVWKRRS